ncbi:N-acetylneuraminate synthase family protein [Desulfocurvus sp. DL9XJH121]
MSLNKIVHVGDKFVGDGCPCFTVVELGVSHEQNVDLARDFIRQAKASGADAVKVESFQADDFAFDKTLTHTYGTADGPRTENYYAMLKRLELSYDDYAKLKQEADEQGILFFSTVHNSANAQVMQDMDVCAFKIASSDVTNLPLIRDLAKRGLPVFMDTGGAYVGEVERGIREFEAQGCENLILMHNPLGYPAPPDKTDLRMIPSLKALFDVPVGLSCHTPGFDMVVAATALGANAMEKPITRDRTLPSPEHIFAFQTEECDEFVFKVRNTEIALGGKRRSSVPSGSYARKTRRGVYAAKAIKAGETLSGDNVVFGRPLKGIPVELADEAMGMTLRRDVGVHEPINWKDLE